MKQITMYGTAYHKGQIVFNGVTHVLTGDNYQTYCGRKSKDGRFCNGDWLYSVEEITCARCRKSFDHDLRNYNLTHKERKEFCHALTT
jgi:hypothetical protein